jgi:hypothetical protein
MNTADTEPVIGVINAGSSSVKFSFYEGERRILGGQVDGIGAHLSASAIGPYLSERQWGTVREDYSDNGDAWNYFTHDQARSRAYHWGEDGLAGFSDDHQRMCFALALWNGKDPILKERLFGLTNSEGNHGEDVKEYYYYLDSTPTHSYTKYLYKYPQNAYPYGDLIETSRRRGRNDWEYELLDTGIFNEDRYFDVFVEYAKAAPGDVLIQISLCNRGPEAASLHVLPTLWFRNTWSWWPDQPKPSLREVKGDSGVGTIAASHARAGQLFPPLRGKSASAVHRKRHQQRAAVRPAQRDALCQGRDQQLCRVGRPRRRQPESNGDQGRRALSAQCWRRSDLYDPPAAQRCCGG